MLLGVFLAVLGDPTPGLHDWLWGAAGGVGGFIGLTLFYYALANGSMTVVAPLAAVVSASLPVGAGLFLGDRPSLIAYVGIVIAIVGIALVTGALGTAHAPTKMKIVGVAALAGCAGSTGGARPQGAAAANADWAKAPGFYLILTNQPGKDSWPISGATFILMHKKQDKPEQAQEALKFFDWAYKGGDTIASQLDYVPMPANVKTVIRNSWKQIAATSGAPVWK